MDASRIAKSMWRDLEARIRDAEPMLLKKLPPGATECELGEVERQLGSKLPPLVREIYRIHNGIGMPAYVQVGEYKQSTTSYFLCLADMLVEWSLLCEGLRSGSFDYWRVDMVLGNVRAQWWNPMWLPITADGAGNCRCIDLDPAAGGVVGQVIEFWHDEGERQVVAPDLATFLLDYVEETEWAAEFRANLAQN